MKKVSELSEGCMEKITIDERRLRRMSVRLVLPDVPITVTGKGEIEFYDGDGE